MKKIIKSILVLLTTNLFYAQTTNPANKLGINTINPQRTLHVNGNLKISKIEDQSENKNYNNILIADANGNVDHALREDFLPIPDADTANKEVYNSIYSNDQDKAIANKEVTCGKFVFLFEQDGAQTDIRFKLKEAPATTSADVYVSMEQNWATGGFEFFQEKYTFTKNTTPDSNDWDTQHDFRASNVADFEQNTIHLQYPNDSAFYRLTIYKVKQTNNWDFVTTCEKF